MAQLGGTFDASGVEPAQPRGEVIPAGEYLVQIIKSEMSLTRKGDGQKLELEMEILDGPYAKRHLWDTLNLVNLSQQAQEIAQRTLSAICHAVGELQVSDSEQLHWKPLIAVVKVVPAGTDKNGYERKEPRNDVGGYKPAGGAARAPASPSRPAPPAAAAARAAPAQAAAAPVAATVPPWRRGKVA